MAVEGLRKYCHQDLTQYLDIFHAIDDDWVVERRAILEEVV